MNLELITRAIITDKERKKIKKVYEELEGKRVEEVNSYIVYHWDDVWSLACFHFKKENIDKIAIIVVDIPHSHIAEFFSIIESFIDEGSEELGDCLPNVFFYKDGELTPHNQRRTL